MAKSKALTGSAVKGLKCMHAEGKEQHPTAIDAMARYLTLDRCRCSAVEA